MKFWTDLSPSVTPGGRERLLLGLMLGSYLGLVSFGFGPYLTDDHAFRQTQTAITAQFLRGLGDLWHYETPVLGPPWSIPFEFPLYQAAAKGLGVATGLSLETAGRLVGVAAMLLCVWPLTRIARLLSVDQPAVVLAPVFLAPLYVFWSRAFMIETTALLFALIYLDQLLHALKTNTASPAQMVGLALSGALASLVKVTTLLPLLLLAGFAIARLARDWMRRRSGMGLLAGLLLAHVMIVLPAWIWLSHADALKAASPLGASLTSKALTQWNFGPLAQRVDPHTWFRLANTTTDILFPLPGRLLVLKACLLVGWMGVFAFLVRRCDAARRWQIAFALVLFLAPYLIFTNLHRIHSYYQAANGVYLLLAFGLSAQGALERPQPGRRTVQAAYGLALLALCISSLWYLHAKSSWDGQLLEISAQLRDHTTSEDVVVVSGQDWSPVIPYQAGRRALMIPGFATPEAVRGSARELQAAGARVTALVRCGSEQDVLALLLLSELGLGMQGPSWQADGCSLSRLVPSGN